MRIQSVDPKIFAFKVRVKIRRRDRCLLRHPKRPEFRDWATMSHSQSLAHFLYTVLPEGCSKGAKMWCWSAHPKINQICGWLSYMLGISWHAMDVRGMSCGALVLIPPLAPIGAPVLCYLGEKRLCRFDRWFSRNLHSKFGYDFKN